jgi:hypothetical protein
MAMEVPIVVMVAGGELVAAFEMITAIEVSPGDIIAAIDVASHVSGWTATAVTCDVRRGASIATTTDVATAACAADAADAKAAATPTATIRDAGKKPGCG